MARARQLWPTNPRLEARDVEKAKHERRALWGAVGKLK